MHRTSMSSDLPSHPLVSVITPSFNQGRYIRETLDSVQRQTYRNFEHIVVDGGSTDETVAILKEYPTVSWTSERDSGQSDALNKGLRRAKGDIIAWINSDDFYEPLALELAVQALKRNHIAMGRCLIFEDGKGPLYTVPNFGRTWFDLLKYWIAYSIPTQPAVFFRRSVLDGLVRHDSEFVDPHLHYCMDYELWTRIAASHPMTARIDAVTSHYRFTDTNKTSLTRPILSYAGAEMSAVFRRAEAMTGAARNISYVIHADVPSEDLALTIRSLLIADKLDAEIIIATSRISGELRRFIEEINTKQEQERSFRFVFPISSDRDSEFGRLADAIDRSCGRIIAVIPAGSTVSSDVATDFGEQLTAAFRDDRIGVVLPFAGNDTLLKSFTEATAENPEHADFSLDSFMFSALAPVAFAMRRVTWLEGPGVRDNSHALRELKRLIVSRIRQGWHARMRLPASVTLPDSALEPCSDSFRYFSGAELILESVEVMNVDPFGGVRNSHALCQPFSVAVIDKARKLLANAPARWWLS